MITVDHYDLSSAAMAARNVADMHAWQAAMWRTKSHLETAAIMHDELFYSYWLEYEQLWREHSALATF